MIDLFLNSLFFGKSCHVRYQRSFESHHHGQPRHSPSSFHFASCLCLLSFPSIIKYSCHVGYTFNPLGLGKPVQLSVDVQATNPCLRNRPLEPTSCMGSRGTAVRDFSNLVELPKVCPSQTNLSVHSYCKLTWSIYCIVFQFWLSLAVTVGAYGLRNLRVRRSISARSHPSEDLLVLVLQEGYLSSVSRSQIAYHRDAKRSISCPRCYSPVSTFFLLSLSSVRAPSALIRWSRRALFRSIRVVQQQKPLRIAFLPSASPCQAQYQLR